MTRVYRKRIKVILLSCLILAAALLSSLAVSYSARACTGSDQNVCNCQNAGGVYISIPISPDNPKDKYLVNGNSHCIVANSTDLYGNPIFYYAIHIIPYLTAGVGIGVTAGIVYAGILYTTAGGNPAQTKKAVGLIMNAIWALLLYIFAYAIINFLVPGGILT